MKKYKMRHYETLKRGLFPRMFPQGKNDGETNQEPRMDQNPEPQRVYGQEPQMEHDIKPQQPPLNETWEWLGNPDEY